MTPLPQQEQGSMAPYAETNNNSHRRQPVPRGQHMPRHPLTRMTGIDRIGLAADSSNAKAPEPKGTLALKTLNGLHKIKRARYKIIQSRTSNVPC